MSPSSPEPLSLRLPARPESVALARQLAGDYLRSLGVGEDRIGRLAVSEIVSNVVRHAYPRTSGGELQLELETDATTIALTVRPPSDCRHLPVLRDQGPTWSGR